jgi:Uma2 family endonuclease
MAIRNDMSRTERFITAEELERLPSDDHRYELVEGRLVPMSPVAFPYGQVVIRIGVRLGGYVEAQNLGAVVTEVGFKLASNPDTVRAPDIAFVRADRIPSGRGFVNDHPDLALEVLSPEDSPSETRNKVEEYLFRGVPLVVVVDPEDRTVTAHRRLSPPIVASADDDVIDFDDVVPGFRCTVGDILGSSSDIR